MHVNNTSRCEQIHLNVHESSNASENNFKRRWRESSGIIRQALSVSQPFVAGMLPYDRNLCEGVQNYARIIRYIITP